MLLQEENIKNMLIRVSATENRNPNNDSCNNVMHKVHTELLMKLSMVFKTKSLFNPFKNILRKTNSDMESKVAISFLKGRGDIKHDHDDDFVCALADQMDEIFEQSLAKRSEELQ